MTTDQEVFTAVGRRKASSARIRLSRGTGVITINGRPLDVYFPTEFAQRAVKLPLQAAELEDQIDLIIRVQGGGVSGQSGAIRHGIARALQKLNPELRPTLKKPGYLKRDPRAKERKKSGQPGARKRFQFSKR